MSSIFNHMFLPRTEDTEWNTMMLQKNDFTVVSLLSFNS